MKNTKRECEVLIIGAGASGVSAAVSASRQGARVLLIEKNDFPGGAGVIGSHRFICGLYVNGKNKPDKTLNEGIAREICSRLGALAPQKRVTRIGKVYVLPFSSKDLISVFRSLLKKKNHPAVLYNSRVLSVKTEKKIIKVVRVRGPKSTLNIIPKVVVDCSGEGAIIRLSGSRYQLSSLKQRQLSGYSFRVKGLRKDDEMLAIKVPYYLGQAVAEKKLLPYLKFTTFSFDDNRDAGIFKLSIAPSKGMNSPGRARADARRVQRYLARAEDSFKNSRITGMLSEVLDREGLRVRGEYILDRDDVLKARKFPDGIVKNSWPIEIWDQEKGPRYQYLDAGDYYQIPRRSLKAKDVLNLYCAGRCISVSHEALGSTRAMGTCMSLGEQAGIAARGYVGGNL